MELIMGLFNFLKRGTKNKALFTGLDHSGKSTIISFLQEGRFVEHVPTMGKDLTEMEVQGVRINFFDMGGQSHFRQMWLGEMDNTKCVVYVIDKSDTTRFKEAKHELGKILPILKKKQIKLLIFANKHDLAPEVDLGQIITEFDLANISNFEIVEVSAKTGYGMTDAFVKFYSILTGQIIRKSVVASAISIYSEGGVPLTVQSGGNEEDFNKNIIEGGFLSAITAFAKTKIKNSSVKFESQEDGTYIILRSENLIGALLWKEDLQIPINVSEEALKELMDHLETLQVYKHEEEISHLVQQYCTNLM
ncbi:MAG: ADP-ribosylation factor-like protein [Promethearchaeota archaeon]